MHSIPKTETLGHRFLQKIPKIGHTLTLQRKAVDVYLQLAVVILVRRRWSSPDHRTSTGTPPPCVRRAAVEADHLAAPWLPPWGAAVQRR